MTVAPGGSWNNDGDGEDEKFVIWKLVESDATLTYPRTPWDVLQMVLVPVMPRATRSTQFMSNPLSDMVEVVTLLPLRPATSETPLRNVVQCDGV